MYPEKNMTNLFASRQEVLMRIRARAFYLSSIGPDISLYHYTDIEGFKGIIDSGTLWATEYRHLNDMEEFRYVEQLIPESVSMLDLSRKCEEYISQTLTEKVQKQSRNRTVEDSFFVACFSLNPDNLTLWAEFTGDKGVNLQLDFNGGLFQNESVRAFPGKVIYMRKQQMKLLKRCFSMVLNGVRPSPRRFIEKSYREDKEKLDEYLEAVGLLIRYYSMYFKKAVYQAEEEYRIVFIPENTKDPVKSHTGKRPYIAVDICSGGEIPLRNIRINPKLHGEEHHAEFRKILEGYPDVRIFESDAWLRF